MTATAPEPTTSSFTRLPSVASDELIDAFRLVWAGLTRPGPCFSGAQRVAVAEVARAARPRPPWSDAPALATYEPVAGPGEVLSPFVTALVETMAVSASTIDRSTAEFAIGTIGDLAYAELGAVVAQVVPIDHLHRVLGLDLEPLPEPDTDSAADGPTGERPDDVADIGSFLPSQVPWSGANVGRAFSLARDDDRMRLRVVRAMYSGTQFDELVWTNRALTRPQIELVAARTSAINECFY